MMTLLGATGRRPRQSRQCADVNRNDNL
jgi:hypothetical protein